MVVSLYVCEIPNNITREDIEHVFSEIEGYLETRTKIANDKRTIAFIDYQTEQDAKCARETLQGFKFSAQDKGLIIKISDSYKYTPKYKFHCYHLLKNKKEQPSKKDELLVVPPLFVIIVYYLLLITDIIRLKSSFVIHYFIFTYFHQP